MIPSLTVFALFCLIAWIQTSFLNRVIKTDLNALEHLPTTSMTPPSIHREV